MDRLRSLALLALTGTALVATSGCGAREDEAGSPTDGLFLHQSLWDDGQAEVAFYRVWRSRNVYGRPADESFLVGTYLVKHDFSPRKMSKATAADRDGVGSFKYALFYAFESGSYEYRRHWVVNARQADLRPLKSSFTQFDWCANSYEEIALPPGGGASYLFRSDDYGNASGRFSYPGDGYPPALLPLLVRAFDFGGGHHIPFSVLLRDGRTVGATAELAGAGEVVTEAGVLPGERIVIRYDAEVPSVVGERTGGEEVWVRGTDPARRLLSLEGVTYRMVLVEDLRLAYWEEDLWPRLTRVSERP
jgi:hypothetical protein